MPAVMIAVRTVSDRDKNQVLSMQKFPADTALPAAYLLGFVEELKFWMNLKNRPFGGIPRARAISSQV